MATFTIQGKPITQQEAGEKLLQWFDRLSAEKKRQVILEINYPKIHADFESQPPDDPTVSNGA